MLSTPLPPEASGKARKGRLKRRAARRNTDRPRDARGERADALAPVSDLEHNEHAEADQCGGGGEHGDQAVHECVVVVRA